MRMRMGSKSSREIFTVWMSGFKSGVGRFTWLFIPKQEQFTRVHMHE